MWRCFTACLVLAVVLVACGDDDGLPQTTTMGIPTTATSAVTSTSGGVSTTSTVPVPWLPAGLQFLDEPTQLPADIGYWDSNLRLYQAGWWPVSMAVFGGKVLLPAVVADGDRSEAGVLSGSTGAPFEALLADDGSDLSAPAGHRASERVIPLGIAADGRVLVMVGAYRLSTPSSITDTGWLGTAMAGIIWRSTDGRTWERLDPAMSALGGGTTSLNAVVATPIGFVAVGYAAELDGWASPSRGLILTSPDGVEWHRAEVSLPWSVQLIGAGAIGERLLVWGIEYVCTDVAPSINTWTSQGEQLRIWSSDDGGTTWQEADVDVVATHSGSETPPADPSGCPDVSVWNELYQQHLAAVGLAAGHFIVWPTDRAVVFSSTDLVAWTTSEVPGARPEQDPVDPANDARWSGAVTDGDVPVLVSIEPARDAAGERRLGFSSQVLGWRLGVDGGWQQFPATRPILMPFGSTSWVFRLGQAGDAAVLTARLLVWAGESGPLVPWGSCDAPAEGSDCAFATVVDAAWSAARLTGIDLSGAVLRRVDLSQADLAGAFLAGALLDDVDLSNATLTGADLSGALVGQIDLTAAVLSGIDLSNSRFDAFYSVYDGTPVNLRGVDFADAVLRGAGFREVDLTGADLADADLGDEGTGDSVSFGHGVICPDGAPPSEEVPGRAACRL
jgi:hypothetical protein